MVIVSNGHHKFILAPLAAELARRRMLSLFVTGGYPSPLVKRLLGTNAFGSSMLARLLDREEKGIPLRLVRAKWVSEVLIQAATGLRLAGGHHALIERLSIVAMENYGRSAARDVAAAEAKIYHYRAGFGHRSVEIAEERGMITICDHSIANPEVLDFLVENNGRWPETTAHREISPFWKVVHKDIKRARYLVVNSEFVKQSFVRFGWRDDRIFVHYVGLDDEFVAAIPPRTNLIADRAPRLLFAGQFSRRKGAEVLTAAIRLLGARDFNFDLIAGIDSDMSIEARWLRGDRRVHMSDLVSRGELAKHMTAADMFVFPSLAEGSARVVFMALASGCYIITTPNSGSIVEDGVHGKLVAPGDARALASAIEWALNNIGEVRRIGRHNAVIAKQRYCQKNYGDATVDLYQNLMSRQLRAVRRCYE